MQQVVIADRYRLLELVGRGGMGRVWRARDETLHREVAVKQVVAPNWLAPHERDELRARTMREARTAARLNHPNVVRVYDVVQVDDDPWLIMEYVPSRSLQEVIEADGPVDPRRAAGIGLAVLAALRAAHAAGVLHRDVKPANVLLARDGRVLLTDFGLAVFDGGDGVMTRPGLVLGSPQYVAPERAAEGVSTAEADLWSLGATLHAAVEGRSPYARSTAMATLAALASQPPDPSPHAGPLEPVLAGLLRRDPRNRLAPDDVARLLAVAAATGPTPDGAHRPTTPTAPTWDSTGGPPVAPPEETDRGTPSPAATAEAWSRAARSGTSPSDPGSTAPEWDRDRTVLLTPVTGSAPAAPPSAPAAARRWGLAAVALVLAAAAGAGTAVLLHEEHERPRGAPGEAYGEPPPGYPPGDGPGQGRPEPPPDGRNVAPPPFACIRPHPVGEPVAAGPSPAEDDLTLPAGWIWHTDAGGFRLAVPAGWWYAREGNTACFQDPASRRILSVEPYAGSGTDLAAQLRSARRSLIAANRLPDYQEVRLAAVAGGAEWECRWRAPYGEQLHALRVLPAGVGGWTLGWSTPEYDWGAATAQLALIRQSFRPGRPTHSAG
ncbi:serine/threonine-protein kinase [Micromonospora mangrovi]|uniref:non-specific serine/threonine protein kinase n=2 Tax=Micromonospora TaxID=1873 RepID=A0AAU7MA98_9ACTN